MNIDLVLKRLELIKEGKGIGTISDTEASIILNEIERLKIIEEKYKDSQLYIHDFKDEIERLNNIIKEVREYLKDLKYDTECCKVCDTMSNKVLEILDKGE